MKEKVAHACHALGHTRVLEEIHRRRGTATAEYLKFMLSVHRRPTLAKQRDIAQRPLG